MVKNVLGSKKGKVYAKKSGVGLQRGLEWDQGEGWRGELRCAGRQGRHKNSHEC